MPWSCGCGVSQADDVGACLACGEVKAAWTVVVERTRTLRVKTTRRLEVFLGVGAAPLALDAPHDLDALAPAAAVPATPVEAARALLAAGQRPAPEAVVFARVAGDAPPVVALEVLTGGRPTTEHEAPAAGRDGTGRHVAPCLFVFGPPSPADDLAFPGLTVVDVTDDAGHAPAVEFSAAGRTVGLPVRAAGATLTCTLLYEDGAPMAGARFRVAFGAGTPAIEGVTDPDGLARVAAPPGATRGRLFLEGFEEVFATGDEADEEAFLDWLGGP